jgi:RimJ/RimL family protein N-acetyltransferase
MPQVDFHAETLPNNAASISLFRSAGYRQLGEHLLHSPAAQ